ncbi:hypothetical protein BDR06DRAFT_1008163 [Suillus hirtellus]|nr:hypothetical protein BDR06DRAFT_1008163 [Suillus hirtellus]
MEIVGDLKEVIKNKKRPVFDHVATDRLELWKVDLPIDEMIQQNLNNLTLDPMKSLSPVDEIIEIFPDTPPCKYLHMIIQCPPAVVDRQIAYLKKGVGTPLAGAKPSAFSIKQDQQEYLCNHPRRATDPVPITLLKPIFAEFMDDC